MSSGSRWSTHSGPETSCDCLHRASAPRPTGVAGDPNGPLKIAASRKCAELGAVEGADNRTMTSTVGSCDGYIDGGEG